MEHQKPQTKIEITLIPGITQETIDKITKAWMEASDDPLEIKPDLNEEDQDKLRQLMTDIILEIGGEISNLTRVIRLGMIYINLNQNGKAKFLRILARDFDIDIKNLNRKVNALNEATNEEEKIVAEIELSKALVPPRVKLLRQLIKLPDGFIFLKEMRNELTHLSSGLPRLEKLDNDLKRLLRSYFDINLLNLVEITWESPAAMLEKLMKYEAVHEIKTWRNMKHRLHSDHRIYAFLHVKMPNEPLIFVEVALVKGMANNIHDLIDESKTPKDPRDADTAIFYSISNTQKGLRGISFGNFLIKRVVKKLKSEFANLTTFATLSPVPGFRKWLESHLAEDCETSLFSDEEQKRISKVLGKKNLKEALPEILNTNWHTDENIASAIKEPLLRFCAHYLIYVKKGNRAYDPVAHFHLSNGAKIQHINWLADVSEKGLSQSAGIMVNYHYRLNKIEINHENYFAEAKVYASQEVRNLLIKK